jgi:ketosteroid isomerase-like protein
VSAGENQLVINDLASAYAAADLDELDRLVADDVVFHIPGRHPLAKTYVGKYEVFGYLATVATLSQSDDGGFEVHSVTTDEMVRLVSGAPDRRSGT